MNEAGLNSLIKKAEKSRDTAGASLATARQEESMILNQIEKLEAYRDEYRQRLQDSLATGTTLHVIRDYQTFLNSLDSSIADAYGFLEKQQKKIRESVQVMESHQKTLTSFTTLAQRQQQSSQQARVRHEARENDEMATQVYLRNLATSTSNFKPE